MIKQILDYSKTVMYMLKCNDTTVKHTYVGHITNPQKKKLQTYE